MRVDWNRDHRTWGVWIPPATIRAMAKKGLAIGVVIHTTTKKAAFVLDRIKRVKVRPYA